MQSPVFKKQIQHALIGAVQKALTIEMLSKIEIELPPLAEQKKIGAFLYSLDKKISLNKKINATLEEMAKTIFLHKFFRKSANGKIGDLIIENPKSTISVGDAKESSGDFPFFTSGENILRWNEKLVDGRNIFLNTGGNAGINFYVGAAAYSTDTWSITAENLADYLYLFLNTIKIEIGKKYFKGTALKHLQKDLLRNHKIYIPPYDELEKFNCVVQPCFDKISENLRENYQLAKLRDFLLPLLMNGQVSFLR
jgi:type I restriction enzyme S subunit